MEKRRPVSGEDSCEAGQLESSSIKGTAIEYADEVPDGFYRGIPGLLE